MTDTLEAHTSVGDLDVVAAAAREAGQVLSNLGVSGESGLSSSEAALRATRFGPNAVASHRAQALAVLWHQLRSPLLGLLLAAAVASYFLGERGDAVIIGVIVGLSVGLGFYNEYRAERAAEALQAAGPVVLGVLTWRALEFWLPIPVSGLTYLSLRPWRDQ